jgi:3',5'-cyclic AMP phosphodiesterase CpdA
MSVKTLAHLSDLHIGRSPRTNKVAALLHDTLFAGGIDHVVVTGDVTHRGRRDELASFNALFEPLADSGRLTVIPGNHDRLGHDLGATLMGSERVRVETHPGLYLVCFDSTGPHNRSWLSSHGMLVEDDIRAVVEALDGAPSDCLSVLLLHHHPVPLPYDHPAELISAWLGWRWAAELGLGTDLLSAVHGRCDLVLHGHRHSPTHKVFERTGVAPLSIFNAGSSSELGRSRIFLHDDGALIGRPWWMAAVDDGVALESVPPEPRPVAARV